MAIAKDSYSVPTYTRWNETQYGKQYSDHIENETMFVSNHKGVLFGLPDSRYGVKINNMIEVDIKHPLENERQFKVDYKVSGTVFFHSDFKEDKVNIKEYYSKGLVYFPAERIWTKIDSLGNVLESLSDVIDGIKDAQDIEETVIEMQKEMEKIINESQTQLKSLTETIEDAKNIDKELSGKLDGYINALNKEFENISGKIDNLTQQSLQDITQTSDNAIQNIKKEFEETINNAQSIINDMDKAVNIAKTSSLEFEKSIKENKQKSDKFIEDANKTIDELFKTSDIKITELNKQSNEIISKIDVEIKNADIKLLEIQKLNKESNDIIKTLSKDGELITNAQKIINDLNKLQIELELLKKELISLKTNLEVTISNANKTNETLIETDNNAKNTNIKLTEKVEEANEIYDKIEEQLAVLDLDKLKEKLAELEKDSHKHSNMNVLNDIKEKDGKLTFKDIAVGVGGTRTQKDKPIDLQVGEQWHQIID